MSFSDTDECSSPGLNSCGDNTKCENYDGGYFCACLVGFESVVKGVNKRKGVKCRGMSPTEYIQFVAVGRSEAGLN